MDCLCTVDPLYLAMSLVVYLREMLLPRLELANPSRPLDPPRRHHDDSLQLGFSCRYPMTWRRAAHRDVTAEANTWNRANCNAVYAMSHLTGQGCCLAQTINMSSALSGRGFWTVFLLQHDSLLHQHLLGLEEPCGHTVTLGLHQSSLNIGMGIFTSSATARSLSPSCLLALAAGHWQPPKHCHLPALSPSIRPLTLGLESARMPIIVSNSMKPAMEKAPSAGSHPADGHAAGSEAH